MMQEGGLCCYIWILKSNGGKISPVELHDYILCNVEDISEIKRRVYFSCKLQCELLCVEILVIVFLWLPLCCE